MKRFVRTFYVRRHVQFSVVDDGEARRIDVYRWAAGEKEVEIVRTILYNPEYRQGAKAEAVACARRLSEEALVARREGSPISRG